MLKITLKKSPIGSNWRQRKTVQALGLKKTNKSVTQEDNMVIRGMIAKVAYLLAVEEIADDAPQGGVK